MLRRLWVCAFAACVLLFASASSLFAAETNVPSSRGTAAAAAPSRTDYTAFKIVADRNIFDASRSGRAAAPRETRPPVRVDTFSLTGTMDYEKGAFAFFDGSSSDFRKVLQCEAEIAGYRITEITVSGVKLESEGRQIVLPVGTQMRREDGGPWQIAEGSAADSSARSGRESNSTRSRSDRSATRDSGSRATAAVSESGSATSGDMNDILKKLMERREQELQ